MRRAASSGRPCTDRVKTKAWLGSGGTNRAKATQPVRMKKKSPGTPPIARALCAQRDVRASSEQPRHHPLRSWLKMDGQKGEAPARGEIRGLAVSVFSGGGSRLLAVKVGANLKVRNATSSRVGPRDGSTALDYVPP